MFVRHILGAWHNRKGFAYVLFHPGQFPLVTAASAWLVTILMVAMLAGALLIGMNALITANDPPNYWCNNYSASEQPEFGCQKGGEVLNTPPR
jgi:hypothetical protein